MKTEKVVISFIAVAIGIMVAGVLFYFYQASKTVSEEKQTTIKASSPTPTPQSSIFLTIDEPNNESVVETKTVTVAGKTVPDATVVITTTITQLVVKPAKNGNFSVTVTIEDGENQIDVLAISPTGQEAHEVKTITYSTENF